MIEPIRRDPKAAEQADRAAELAKGLPLGYIARACRGKNTYGDKATAKRVSKLASSRFGGEPKVAYRCKFCGSFHIGRDLR
jgi:hypothetical protein